MESEEVLSRGCTVTFTPVLPDGQMLWIRRAEDDDELPNHWGFPGGRVRANETAAAAVVRECSEEVGVQLTGRGFFVDSYILRGGRTGYHYAVEAASPHHELSSDIAEARWLATAEEVRQLSPRIRGVDSHMEFIMHHLNDLERFASNTQCNLSSLVWRPLATMDLVKERFVSYGAS